MMKHIVESSDGIGITDPKEMGASAEADRAVVNEAGQAVSALRASVPSAGDWVRLVLAAFDAGVRRGNDEAVSYEWGASPNGKYHDELEDALHDWGSEGRDWRGGDLLPYDAVRSALAQAIEARQGGNEVPSQDESAVHDSECAQPSGRGSAMKQKIERLRESAKAFRENPVYTQDGDGCYLTVQADELDWAADHIDALEARVEEAETIAGIATIPDVAGMAERLEAAERARDEAKEQFDNHVKWASDQAAKLEEGLKLSSIVLEGARAWLRDERLNTYQYMESAQFYEDKAMQWLIRWPGRVRPSGWRGREPLSLYWNPDYDSLTRKGLALRAYLKGQSDD